MDRAVTALPPRDFEAEAQAGVDAFDRSYFETYGRYPEESPLFGTTPTSTRRRDAIQALIDRGATEGERAAAQAAMLRLDNPSTQAHAATEQGSYYARDTLAGSADE